mgnify:CR=1 FL=1
MNNLPHPYLRMERKIKVAICDAAFWGKEGSDRLARYRLECAEWKCRGLLDNSDGFWDARPRWPRERAERLL